MAERPIKNKLTAIGMSVDNLIPSSAWGGCKADAQTVIEHLTKKTKLCKVGEPLRLLASDFDAPTDRLTIYSVKAGGLTQVDYHTIALMDDEIVVDLGREKGNRVFYDQDYFTLIRQLQR